MSDFNRLQQRVADDELRLVHIVSIPRSRSTALGRALTGIETPSIFVNEPFNGGYSNLEHTAGVILDAADKEARLTDNESLTVVTKSMASRMASADHIAMMQLAGNVVYTIRRPHVQIGSLVTRIANDQIVLRGANKLTQNEIEPHLDFINSFLQLSERSVNYSLTGWESIARLQALELPEIKSAIVDGGALIDRPEEILAETCARIGLEYSPRMVSGWQGKYVRAANGFVGPEAQPNAWYCDATMSTGIVANERAPLDTSRLPRTLRHHIEAFAMPQYEAMTADTFSVVHN